jgi:Zn-dependent oligopeptidase
LNEFEVWDYAFYQRKYEKTQNNFDISSVKPYFEAKQVISWMFEIIQKLFGIHLTESDIPTYGEGNVYEAYKDGVLLWYLWCDFYESDKKMTWAWAESIRSWSTINARWERVKKHKIVINAGNITQKTDGDTLLDFRDVETLFHEIGHALHELCYEWDFLSLSGLHTEDDFVELPSQLLENWCRSPEGLKYIAKHHITWEALPEETILKILESRSFHSAYGVVRYLMFSFYDLALHSKDIPQDWEEFDIFSLQELQEKSLFPVQDYFTLYANLDHLFYEADSMYAAGYFSYIWAEMIEQDIWNAFKSSWDVFNPELAEKYYRTILAQWFMKPW